MNNNCNKVNFASRTFNVYNTDFKQNKKSDICFGSNYLARRAQRFLKNAAGKLIETPSVRKTITDTQESLFVDMGYYAIGKIGFGFEKLKTSSLKNCVGLTLYDPVTQTGFLSHIPAGNPDKIKNSFRSILNELYNSGVNIQNMKARIIGGESLAKESEQIISNIERQLEKYNIELVEKDVYGETARNIILDLNTGDVHSYDPIFPSNMKNVSLSMVMDRLLLKEPKSPKITPIRNNPRPILCSTDALEQEILALAQNKRPPNKQ